MKVLKYKINNQQYSDTIAIKPKMYPLLHNTPSLHSVG